MATQQRRTESNLWFVRLLAEAGLSDFIVISKETAESVLTTRRLELLERLRDADYASMTELAEDLGRDKAAVSRDLDLLFEHALVDYERNGRRKRPVLAHETVLVEPLL